MMVWLYRNMYNDTQNYEDQVGSLDTMMYIGQGLNKGGGGIRNVGKEEDMEKGRERGEKNEI